MCSLNLPQFCFEAGSLNSEYGVIPVSPHLHIAVQSRLGKMQHDASSLAYEVGCRREEDRQANRLGGPVPR